METAAKPLIFSISIFVLCSILAQSDQDPCRPAFCNDPMSPPVRFPFRLKDQQPERCGYPGFDLSCNRQNQTILSLPQSGDFKVNFIDYRFQTLFINDPNYCLPKRILNFSLSDSSFTGNFMRSYTFLNCSSDWMGYRWSNRFVQLHCLGGKNYTVLGTQFPPSQMPPSCRRIAVVSVPLRWSASQFYWSWTTDLTDDLQLGWDQPACIDCEKRGGFCRYKSGSVLEIGCSKSGLSRVAIYGLTMGIGIPALLLTIGLLSYAIGKARRGSNLNFPTYAVSEPRLMVRAIGGLDTLTIASYPKTVLGVSGRLPKPADGTCPICLCEYLPKETLKSIPKCQHYFHAECIDEWLKLNGTCPLCRNSPQSSTTTHTSPVSLSSPTQPSTPSDHEP